MPGTASVFTLPDDGGTRAESAAWARFAGAGDAGEFHGSWLALLCLQVPQLRAAVLLLGEQEAGPFTVAAAWPDPRRDLTHLGPAAQRTLESRRGLATAPDGGETAPEGPAHVGYPLLLDGRLLGAVVFDLGAGAPGELQRALRRIHWASAWMIDRFRQQAFAVLEAERARLAQVSGLMATALQQRPLGASALAVADELAAGLACDRVAVGFEDDDRIVPLALSHTAHFDARSDLVRALGDAMDEVLDLGCPVQLPRPPDDERGTLAHEQAARTLGCQAMLTVPLVHEGSTIGAITFERSRPASRPFGAAEQAVAAAAGLMLGPLWALQRRLERPWPRRLRDAVQHALRTLAGPRRPGLKLAGATGTLLLAALALWPADHRVAARSVVEGATQRAAVAPFDGFIAESLVRAGDTVRQGQPLARLEDRDLRLERSRWQAEAEQARRKAQVALAQADRGTLGVLAAQAQQAEAQLALLEERLARAQLVAPFDAVVVGGDLSQSVGAPVEQGRVLYELAPLQGFRVVLQVDERDIARLAIGQRGEMVLASLPDRALPFTVSTITSVATAHEGRNVFRVEASLPDAPARLRPGMEGVGKVVVGQRSLLWIWTHGLLDWARLALWAWWP